MNNNIVAAESNIVKHRQNKRAPYTKIQRKERREEVYRLHFERGMPATRIAEMMKVDRNTINNDLKILYNKAIKNNSEESFSDIIDKHLVRLETQRDRLGLYLTDTKDISTKIALERQITDIDFKVIGLMERLDQGIIHQWDLVTKHANHVAEKENLQIRYTSLFELYRISIDTREDLNKLIEKAK